MKNPLFLTTMILYLALFVLQAQDVKYSLANFQATKASPSGSVEFDGMIESRAGFTMGSGQIYFDYNADAFGEKPLL